VTVALALAGLAATGSAACAVPVASANIADDASIETHKRTENFMM
jgi:hypothetical protein